MTMFGSPSGWTTFDTALVLSANIVLAVIGLAWWIRRLNMERKKELERLVDVLERLQSEWRFHHEQATYVGTIKGYWRVLELGLENGGLDPEFRRTIYRAGDEMFDAFNSAAREYDHQPAAAARIWRSR